MGALPRRCLSGVDREVVCFQGKKPATLSAQVLSSPKHPWNRELGARGFRAGILRPVRRLALRLKLQDSQEPMAGDGCLSSVSGLDSGPRIVGRLHEVKLRQTQASEIGSMVHGIHHNLEAQLPRDLAAFSFSHKQTASGFLSLPLNSKAALYWLVLTICPCLGRGLIPTTLSYRYALKSYRVGVNCPECFGIRSFQASHQYTDSSPI